MSLTISDSLNIGTLRYLKYVHLHDHDRNHNRDHVRVCLLVCVCVCLLVCVHVHVHVHNHVTWRWNWTRTGTRTQTRTFKASDVEYRTSVPSKLTPTSCRTPSSSVRYEVPISGSLRYRPSGYGMSGHLLYCSDVAKAQKKLPNDYISFFVNFVVFFHAKCAARNLVKSRLSCTIIHIRGVCVCARVQWFLKLTMGQVF